MPAKEFMTLLDVLQQEGTGSIKALDAVRSVGLASPEVTAFPVTVIDGTQYEINMPTGIPRFGFRPANAGAKNLTTEYTNKTVKCYYIDGPIAVDKAVVTSSARGAAAHQGNPKRYVGCHGLHCPADVVQASGTGKCVPGYF